MGKCNITAAELAEALDITKNQLEDICDFFDSDPDDDWDLERGKHYEIGAYGARVYSAEGAVEICNYLEHNKKERPLLKRWKRWLLQRDRRLKGLMISKRIQEISESEGQIVFRGGRAFLAPRASRDILGLGTRQDVLNDAFQAIQIPQDGNTERESLKPDEDFFIDDENSRYFSRTGIAVIGHELGIRLKQKHRKEWMKVLVEYGPKAILIIEKDYSNFNNLIIKAQNKVCSEAKGRCQLTGNRKSVDQFNLEAHHLFDKHTYRKLAAMETNIIAIDGRIHADFHKWMGGPKVSCTVDDFQRYVEERESFLFQGKTGQAQAMTVRKRLSDAKKSLKGHL